MSQNQNIPGQNTSTQSPPPAAAEVRPVPPAEQPSYRELERRYRHRTYQAQELMIEKLLRSRVVSPQSLERKLNMFDLHLDQSCFMLVLVRPGDQSAAFSEYAGDLRDGGQVGLIVSSIFSELLGEHFGTYPANLDDSYAFLLNFPDGDRDEYAAKAVEISKDAVRFIRSNFSLDLKVCISAICEGIEPVHDLFRETEMMANDAETPYTDHVSIQAGSLMAAGPRKPEPSIEKQYLNALVIQDFSSACKLTLDRIHSMYNDAAGHDLEHVKIFLSMRMRTTGNVLSTPSTDLGSYNLGDECRLLDSAASMEELENILKRIFSHLDANYNNSVSEYTGTTGRVVNLINKKYMEPDLSVEMICDTLGKSRSYLSRMFKENTGMNLLDFLHTTRLTHAKKLLNDTDLGISEIAAKVGYYSGWTLARVFKRYEGITPTAYRKAFCSSVEP